MGQAKRRGTKEERIEQAKSAGRFKPIGNKAFSKEIEQEFYKSLLPYIMPVFQYKLMK